MTYQHYAQTNRLMSASLAVSEAYKKPTGTEKTLMLVEKYGLE